MHGTGSRRRSCKYYNRAEELSNDESDADYDGDEDFVVGGEGQPRLKQVLRLLRPVPTRWNSIYYTIKRALALKDLLVMFSNSERARNGKSPPTKPHRIQRESVVLESPSYQDPCPSF